MMLMNIKLLNRRSSLNFNFVFIIFIVRYIFELCDKKGVCFFFYIDVVKMLKNNNNEKKIKLNMFCFNSVFLIIK